MSDSDRCQATITYPGDEPVSCDREPGHDGVHSNDQAAVIWTSR